MNITFWLNGVKRQAEVRPDELLLDFLRKNSCYSVKRGCETANCGLCTVLMDERPVLSCSMLAARADGKRIVTLEGMQEEAKEFGAFMANEGAEQCGFCKCGKARLEQERQGYRLRYRAVQGRKVDGACYHKE